jgi:cytochrome c556
MRGHARGAALGAAGLLLGLGVLAGRAADDKELQATVQKTATAFEKNDVAEAKKLAAEVAKNTKDFEDVMHLFAPRTPKPAKRPPGWGVGPKSGVITPDGIEKKLEALADKGKLPADRLNAEADALTEMGYRVAAIGEVSLAKKPAKDEGKKKVADWVKWSQEMRSAGLALAAAAKKKDAAGVEKAAKMANDSCTKCHAVYRYE